MKPSNLHKNQNITLCKCGNCKSNHAQMCRKCARKLGIKISRKPLRPLLPNTKRCAGCNFFAPKTDIYCANCRARFGGKADPFEVEQSEKLRAPYVESEEEQRLKIEYIQHLESDSEFAPWDDDVINSNQTALITPDLSEPISTF